MPTDLMQQRKAAIDWAAAAATPVLCGLRDDRCRVRVAEFRVTGGLVSRLAGLLDRHRGEGGPGIALLSGPPGPLMATRQFSVEIMTALRVSSLLAAGGYPGPGTRAEETVTADGAIPLELFGSAWTFKPPHMDRESLYFSHVYGPARGFSGGEVILIDALAFAAARSLHFDQAFEWSDEPEIQKPVLRREHVAAAVTEFGVNLGALPDHDILIVNNTPDGGILHGATELRDISPGFTREIHRVAIRPGHRAEGNNGGLADGGREWRTGSSRVDRGARRHRTPPARPGTGRAGGRRCRAAVCTIRPVRVPAEVPELGDAHQPRARHSSRWGRSAPRVVSLPWPG